MLATLAADGRPRLVPITYAADTDATVLYSALDEKPKRVGPRRLARVRDILERPTVSLLVDHWSEDWSELAWLRLDGEASLLEPADTQATTEHARAVSLLRQRYPQYAGQALEQRPILRVTVRRATSWRARG